MKNTILLTVFLIFSLVVSAQLQKVPAYPLITHDPYFSIWSFTDDLTTGSTKHWTGADQPLTGWVKVDKQLFRFMGQGNPKLETSISEMFGEKKEEAFPVAQLKEVTVTATRTIYQYTCGAVDLRLQFTSPLLLNNWTVLTRPVSYISFTLQAT